MSTLRHFHDDETRTKCFVLQTNPLIKFSIEGGVAYAQTIEDKMQLLSTKQDGDRFVIPRQGVSKTDVFDILDEDIERFCALFSA